MLCPPILASAAAEQAPGATMRLDATAIEAEAK
jgi:hypothetical protein